MNKKTLMEMTKLFVNAPIEEDVVVETPKGLKEDNFQTFTVWVIKEFNEIPSYDDYRNAKKIISKGL